MLTIISGTNRKGNNTIKIAREYQRLFTEKKIETKLFSLEDIDVSTRNPEFLKLEQDILIPASRFIFIMPEYNGSYPGILKLMIDNCDINKVFAGKKVLLTGVSTGRAGNLRGMDHLTGCLLYLKMLVHPNRLPLSVVDTLLNEKEELINEQALNAVKIQLEEFLEF